MCLAPGSYAIEVTPGLHDDEVGWNLGAGALRGAAPEPGQSFVVTGEGSIIKHSSRDLLETTTFECSESRASTDFSSISTEANVSVLGISNSDDATEAVSLPFAFPWFASTVTSLVVSTNGQINMDGADGNNCCSVDEISIESGYEGDRVALAQGDLNPFAGGTIYYLAKENSVVVSYEAVPFYFDDGEVNAQVEFFENGLIELRWGSGSTSGKTMASGLQSDAFSVFARVITAGDVGWVNGVTAVWPTNSGVNFLCSVSPTSLPTFTRMPTSSSAAIGSFDRLLLALASGQTSIQTNGIIVLNRTVHVNAANLDVQGPAVFDALFRQRFFTLENSTLSLRDVTLRGGYAATGGCVYAVLLVYLLRQFRCDA